jgi:anti-sigma28 factor (negative regulator of flagellin synthesis)
MKRNKVQISRHFSLRKKSDNPISLVSNMTISNLTTSTILPMQRTTASPATEATAPAQDQAVLNMSAGTFSSLVQAANSMPEVRPDVVETYQARIAAGHYPAQEVIAGLTKLVGGAIMQKVNSGSSSES